MIKSARFIQYLSVVVLTLGLIAGRLLVSRSQDIREKAAVSGCSITESVSCITSGTQVRVNWNNTSDPGFTFDRFIVRVADATKPWPENGIYKAITNKSATSQVFNVGPGDGQVDAGVNFIYDVAINNGGTELCRTGQITKACAPVPTPTPTKKPTPTPTPKCGITESVSCITSGTQVKITWNNTSDPGLTFDRFIVRGAHPTNPWPEGGVYKSIISRTATNTIFNIGSADGQVDPGVGFIYDVAINIGGTERCRTGQLVKTCTPIPTPTPTPTCTIPASVQCVNSGAQVKVSWSNPSPSGTNFDRFIVRGAHPTNPWPQGGVYSDISKASRIFSKVYDIGSADGQIDPGLGFIYNVSVNNGGSQICRSTDIIKSCSPPKCEIISTSQCINSGTQVKVTWNNTSDPTLDYDRFVVRGADATKPWPQNSVFSDIQSKSASSKVYNVGPGDGQVDAGVNFIYDVAINKGKTPSYTAAEICRSSQVNKTCTPVPTSTPIPTATPKPTATPTPLPPPDTPDSTLYFTHTNHQGSVIALTDEGGGVVSQDRYFPFGEEKASQGDKKVSERKYTSQIKDQETDLYYYNARYYDPALSTFMSADNVGGNLNRYAYVSGNPVNSIDPSGNKCLQGSWLKAIPGVAIGCFIVDTVVDAVKVVKQDANYILNTDAPVGEKAVAGIDLFTVGGFRGATFSMNNYMNFLAENPDSTYVERIPYAVPAGLNVTFLSAEVVGWGQALKGFTSAITKMKTLKPKVLDIGSAGGQKVRTPRSRTTTLDIIPQPGVDIAGDARLLPLKDEAYGIITSDYLPTEAYMGGRGTPAIATEMDRVLTQGGTVSIKAADVLQHGDDFIYPHNAWWQNFTDMGYGVSYEYLGGGTAGAPGGPSFYMNQYMATFVKPH